MASAPESHERLAQIGSLKREAADQRETDGLVHSGRVRQRDTQLRGLSPESRFDLAYNASHALALAALRRAGYRSDNRYLVFQCLPHTLGVGADVWRVLALCHERRNRAEYAGDACVAKLAWSATLTSHHRRQFEFPTTGGSNRRK